MLADVARTIPPTPRSFDAVPCIRCIDYLVATTVKNYPRLNWLPCLRASTSGLTARQQIHGRVRACADEDQTEERDISISTRGAIAAAPTGAADEALSQTYVYVHCVRGGSRGHPSRPSRSSVARTGRYTHADWTILSPCF
jgi:hypothetical protein